MGDFNERNIKDFNPWRPTNQLPFPGIAGQILLTKSDFTLPARPDLLEWKKVEEVIGVYDVSMEIAEDGLSATFYKIVNLEKIAIGTIGIVTRPEAEKLKAIKYVKYSLVANTEDHEMKFYGTDKDNNTELIGDVISYVSMLDINRLDGRIDTEHNQRVAEDTRLDGRIDDEREERVAEVSRLDGRIDTEHNQRVAEDTRLDGRIDDEHAERVAEVSRLDGRIDTEITDRQTADTRLANDITLLQNRATELENKQNNIILPIINILKTATNPELVLVKDADGVGIRWANRLGIDGVEIRENATNNIISFWQSKNGVWQQIGQIDKFSYSDYQTFKDILIQIQDDLNESSESGYVLAKLQDGDRYDWQSLSEIITFEKIEGSIFDTIKIKINDVNNSQLTFKILNENKVTNILQRLAQCETDIQDIQTFIGSVDISDIGATITQAISNLKSNIDDINTNKAGLWQGTNAELTTDFDNIPNGTIIAIEEA